MSLPAAALKVGNGWVSLSPLPGRGGDLAGDLDALAAWEADVVVSLTEAQEMEAGPLAAGLQTRKIGWMHLPVPDFGVPDGPMVAPVLAGLQDRLARGGRVALHCKGGCGRSGALALRLMVLSGEDPGDALLRLRAVRACAVETEMQRLWASGSAPQMPTLPPMPDWLTQE